MNILLINKFYEYRGGAESHVFALQKMLESHGHSVIIFSTRNRKTLPNKWIKYFPKYYDLSDRHNIFYKSLACINIFINFSACYKLKKLIKKNKIDVAHVHNIYHHLSPAILRILKNAKIPVVATLHDYKLICPNYSLFNFQEGKVCEKCKNGKYFNCSKFKCIKNSRLKSFILSCEMYFQKTFFPYSDLIDTFIAPSEFIKNKFLEFGFKNKNIQVIPNFISSEIPVIKNEQKEGNCFLYFGRLAKEKGLEQFIKMLVNLERDFKFCIIGNGPEEKRLKQLVIDLKLDSKIMFLGFFGKSKQEELNDYISKAQFIVVPSIWYENCSMSIIESMMSGKLVLASNIGGNRELIDDGNTGMLFDPHNIKESIDKIRKIMDNKELIEAISINARKSAMEKFGEEGYYNKLISLYKISNNFE